MVNATALLVASSESVVWFAAILPHSGDLREAGLLDEADGTVTVLAGVEMTVSGYQYTAFIIHMTPLRRMRVLAATAHARKSALAPDVDFSALAREMLASEAAYDAHANNWVLKPDDAVRPKRQVVRCAEAAASKADQEGEERKAVVPEALSEPNLSTSFQIPRPSSAVPHSPSPFV